MLKLQRRNVLTGLTGLGAVVAGFGSSLVRAQQGERALQLTLATATPGGSFPAFGEALVAALRESDPDIAITLRNTKGSAENLPLLRSGEVDLALVQGEYAYDALASQDETLPRLTVVAPIDAPPGLFVVPGSSPIRRVEDLRGKPVILGTHGSGLTMMGRTVLEGSGIDPERGITPILLDYAGQGAGLLQEGKAAALWGAGLDWPSFRTLADASGGARFFGPAPEAVDPILNLRGSLRRLTVPAGSFKGQDASIETVGSWSFVLARPRLPDAAVARVMAAADRGRDAIKRRYAQGAESDPRNLAKAVPAAWLHPAAAVYLQQIGIVPQ